jgi:hypothetical protein
LNQVTPKAPKPCDEEDGRSGHHVVSRDYCDEGHHSRDLCLSASYICIGEQPIGLVKTLLTVLKTFFSTDIVKYQNSPDGKAMYSGLALTRWLEVTVPLTVMTVLMGLVAFIIADRRRRRRLPSSYDEKKSA